MTILFETGAAGAGPGGGGTGNNARISLVIDAPDQKQFAGIDAAGKALTNLEAQLKRVNDTMKDLGLKQFPDVGKTVTDQGKRLDDLAANIGKVKDAFGDLGEAQRKFYSDHTKQRQTGAVYKNDNLTTTVSYDANGVMKEEKSVENLAAKKKQIDAEVAKAYAERQKELDAINDQMLRRQNVSEAEIAERAKKRDEDRAKQELQREAEIAATSKRNLEEQKQREIATENDIHARAVKSDRDRRKEEEQALRDSANREIATENDIHARAVKSDRDRRKEEEQALRDSANREIATENDIHARSKLVAKEKARQEDVAHKERQKEIEENNALAARRQVISEGEITGTFNQGQKRETFKEAEIAERARAKDKAAAEERERETRAAASREIAMENDIAARMALADKEKARQREQASRQATKDADDRAKTDARVVRDGAKAIEDARKSEKKVRDESISSNVDVQKALQSAREKNQQEAERSAKEQQMHADGLRKKQQQAMDKARSDAVNDAYLRLKQDLSAAETFKQQRLSTRTPSPNRHTEREERQRIEAGYEGRKASAYRRAERTLATVDPQEAAGHALNASKAYTSLAGALHHASVASNKFDESSRYVGKNMLQNIAHVTAWSASVGVLYGSLRVLKESVGALVELQYQQARLSVVMNLSQSETTGLTDDILRLAAANGRSGDDAMKAATKWARLGMTKKQVAEATRVSLVAANVAEVTAAEATESLSAIMVTYGLHAGQLNGVLGMLNQTSNTYNVTVAELLNGLERVSSVAKQAGLSLAETQGIIGAAVGATGQTGANIGNSLKSFIGAVSGEEGQKNLRSFGIETTSGGEVKDMTRIVNELYVAYQRMSEAERRTMIFSTVGKNQASRVTAMLDNYVKSQVLAINSLNNLNSAGKENEVILSTMKSQLQGVITEWQRFVALQAGNIGKVGNLGGSFNQGSPLTQSMKAIGNVGKLANTTGGSMATTAALGLLTAVLMRMGIEAYRSARGAATWSEKGGIMKETAKSVGVAVNGLKTTLMAASVAADGTAAKMATLSVAGQRVAMAMGAAKLAIKGIGSGIAGYAVFQVVIGAFNQISDKILEMTGNNSDEVITDAESMGHAAEVTSRAAEGYSIAARLFQTSKDAMTEALQKPGQADATMSQILSQITGLNTSLPGVEARMKDASKSVAEFMSALETEKINALSQQYIKQAQAISEINKQVAKLQAQTDRLNATKPIGMDNDTWLKKRVELEGKLAEAKNSKVKVVSSAANQMKQDIADQFNTSVVGLRFLDQQKMVLSEISHIYKEIGANSDYSTQQDLEVHRLRVVADLNANILKSLEGKKKAIEDAHKTVKPEEEQKRQEAIMGPLTTKREELARALAEAQNVSMVGAPDAAAGQQIARQQQAVAAAKAALLANQKEIDEASKQLAKESSQTEEKTNYKKVLHAIGPATDAKLKSEAEAQAAEAEAKRRIAADSARFRYTALAGTERARVDASGVGDDEFDKWSAKKKYLDDQRRLFEAKGGNATQDEKLQQLEREKEGMGMLKDAAVQREVLEGKIGQHVKDRTKEYRKQLMMMGPGEMLRGLAMAKLAPTMTGGQLLSIAPEGRKDYEGITGRDATYRELDAAREGFSKLDLSAKAVGESMSDAADRIRKLLSSADDMVKPTLASLPGDLVNALSKVDKLNVNAANVVVNQGAANPIPAEPVAGARASGGPVLKDKTYLVGENGPELVKMQGAGTVVPNSQIAKSGMPVSWEKLDYMRNQGLEKTMAKNPVSLRNTANYAGRSLGGVKQASTIGESAFSKLGRLGRGALKTNPFTMAAGIIAEGAYSTANEIKEMRKDVAFREHKLNLGMSESDYWEYGFWGKRPPSQSAEDAFGLKVPNVSRKEVPNSIAAYAASEQAPARSQDPYGPSHDNEESHTRFPLEPADRKRYSKPYAPYATVAQPGRQPVRTQQAAAAPRIPVAGGNVPIGNAAPAQAQGGAFPAVMAAASAAVATFSGAIATAASNVDLFSKALTTAIANMGPRTAFSGAPANADNPFS